MSIFRSLGMEFHIDAITCQNMVSDHDITCYWIWVSIHAYSFKKNIFDIKFCHKSCKKRHETCQIINNILLAFTLFCYSLQLAMSQLAVTFCCQIMFGGILDFPPFYTSHLPFGIFIHWLIFGRILSLKIFL